MLNGSKAAGPSWGSNAESMAHSVIVDELEVVEIREVPCRCSARKLETKDCKPKAHDA